VPPKVLRSLVRVPTGYRSSETASFFAQLDELSARMLADMKSCPPAELAWQPGRGMNTIGMLLAHNAIVEGFWIMIAAGSYAREKLDKALGIGEYDDGMPLPANGAPPAALRGRNFAFYRKLHDRARSFAKRTGRGLAEADLDRIVKRRRPDGTRREMNVRWILYHVLEHQAGHYGQMLLLRHQYRGRRKARKP